MFSTREDKILAICNEIDRLRFSVGTAIVRNYIDYGQVMRFFSEGQQGLIMLKKVAVAARRHDEDFLAALRARFYFEGYLYSMKTSIPTEDRLTKVYTHQQ